MNIGDLITGWKNDYNWIGGVPNYFLKKDFKICPNPANYGEVLLYFYVEDNTVNECPHVPKLEKFKPPRCPIGVYWNTLCLMRDVCTIKTYMI
jgi:hypothetical protein